MRSSAPGWKDDRMQRGVDGHLRYRILGPVSATGAGGVALSLGGPKQTAVLAALLLNANRVVTEDYLLAVVWGEEVPASARAQLQTYVSLLRKQLGRPAAIVRRRPGYVIATAAGELDLDLLDGALQQARAERAGGRPRQAAGCLRVGPAHWGGPVLGGTTEYLVARGGRRWKSACWRRARTSSTRNSPPATVPTSSPTCAGPPPSTRCASVCRRSSSSPYTARGGPPKRSPRTPASAHSSRPSWGLNQAPC